MKHIDQQIPAGSAKKELHRCSLLNVDKNKNYDVMVINSDKQTKLQILKTNAMLKFANNLSMLKKVQLKVCVEHAFI